MRKNFKVTMFDITTPVNSYLLWCHAGFGVTDISY